MSILVAEEESNSDADELPFEPRNVKVRRDKWVTDEFNILGFLGRGKFGEVKQCIERKTGKNFAAKFISAPGAQEKKEVEHEINIMKKLQHKRILQLYDAFASKNEMCLVLELISGGELLERVIDEDFILTERACVVFLRQICEGVNYMHNCNIIHLDMKPENILCFTRIGNKIKIIDFGLAREYQPGKELRVLFGTPEFMAPEIVNYETISFPTDMWSIGVIAYVLLSGLSPFMGDSDGETMLNVMKAEYDFSYNEFTDVTSDAKDLIGKLLVKDKNKRLTAAECLAHPWLAKQRGPKTPTLLLSKKRLRRFVIRRKWMKVVNAMVALKRMGGNLCAVGREPVQIKEPIFSWKTPQISPIPDQKGKTGTEKGPSKGTKHPQKPAIAPKPDPKATGSRAAPEVAPKRPLEQLVDTYDSGAQEDDEPAVEEAPPAHPPSQQVENIGEDSAYSTTSNDDHEEVMENALEIREKPAFPSNAVKVKRKPAIPTPVPPPVATQRNVGARAKNSRNNISDRISKFQSACAVSSSFTDRKTKMATTAVNRVRTEDKTSCSNMAAKKKNKRRPPPLQLSFSEDDNTDGSSTSSAQAKSTDSIPHSVGDLGDVLDARLFIHEQREDFSSREDSNGQESSSTLDATPCNDVEFTFDEARKCK